MPPRGAGGRLCDGDGTFAGHREKVSQMCQLCQGSQRGDIKSRGERINEFTGLSLDPRNLILQDSVSWEIFVATVQGRAKKILLSLVTHVPSGLMGSALAA